MGFDYSEYIKWGKKFGVTADETKEWLKLFLLKEANEVVARAKLRTPYDTGTLRESFAIGDQNIVLMDDPTGRMGVKSSNRAFQVLDEENSTDPTIGSVSDNITVVISNPTKYASYIEYGHHLNGEHPYFGKYMLAKSANEVQLGMGDRLNKQFENYLKKRGVF